jgi:hypothetical protein
MENADPLPDELMLHPRRVKFVLFTLLMLAGTALGVGLVCTGERWGWWLAAGGVVMGVLFAAGAIPRLNHLYLHREGFVVTALGYADARLWADVAEFEVVVTRRHGIPVYKNVVVRVRGPKAPIWLVAVILRRPRNCDVFLPDTYGMKAPELAALLERWRQRAAEDAAARAPADALDPTPRSTDE